VALEVSVDIALVDRISACLKRIDRAFVKSARTAERAGKAFKAAGASISRVGQRLTLGLTLPIVGVGLASIKMATDVEESINAVNVVFGKGADTILKFGQTASTTVGLSTAAFNQLSTETGALLADTGLSMEMVATTTNELALRAADLASVFNTDVKIAMSAITQAIRGETEAIRKFSGDVTDATLEQFLLAKGIRATVSSMSQQEKRLLRIKVLMDQTRRVAGDFKNTQESLANQTRILRARIADLAAKFGQIMIPIATKLILKLSKMVDFFEAMSPEIKKTVLIVLSMVAALGPLLVILGPVLGALGSMALIISSIAAGGGLAAVFSAAVAAIIPFLPVILGVLAAVAAIAFVIKTNFPAFKAIAITLWQTFRAIAIPALTIFKTLWVLLKPLVVFFGKVLGTVIVVQLLLMLEILKLFIEGLELSVRVLNKIGEALGFNTAGLDRFLAELQDASGSIGDAQKTIINQITGNNLFQPNNVVNVETNIELKKDESGKITGVAVATNADSSRVKTIDTGATTLLFT